MALLYSVLVLRLLFPLLLLLLLPLPSPSLSIPLNSTLLPSSDPWSSPNKTFTLLFHPHPLYPSLFLLSITPSSASSISLWSPTTLPLSPSSSLTLLPSGNLLLLNSTTTVWQSSTANLGITSALLSDAGNLLLLNSTNQSLWDSFSHPSDTLIQSQNLTSSLSLTSGLYSFKLDSSGNLILSWNSSVPYFNNGLNSSITNLTSPSLSLLYNGDLTISDPSLPSSPATIAKTDDYGDKSILLRFLRLDSDGNLRAYSYSSGTTSPAAHWTAIPDQCRVFGYCGNMGLCSYNTTGPICNCPSQNFEFVDANNPKMGCRITKEIRDCTGNSTMVELDNTQFLYYDSEQSFNAQLTSCRQICLTDPSCLASTLVGDGSGHCYFKTGVMSFYQSPALPSKSFVKVCNPAVPNVVSTMAEAASVVTRSTGRWWMVMIVSVAGVVVVEWGLWWCFFKDNLKFTTPTALQYTLLEYASGAPVQFSYKELVRATKGFKERLGSGGFGSVYKGVLSNKSVVAVKQLEGIQQGERQFRMEVATIGSTHHLNLVRLIGFCLEGRHRLLVYEFMKNGSLDSFLFSTDPQTMLPWDVRYSVALGTARGITYLHQECRDCIIHCDIKPENILLDNGYIAKVSDFGLAKLVNANDHRYRTLTSVRGTRGYLAPEWLANLPITAKSDVYSFGMVLLEIVCGRRNYEVSEETCRKKFSTWAYEEYEKGNVLNIVDKRLVEKEVDMGELHRAVLVSFWCIQEQPLQRPMMGRVVQMLEGVLDIERPPAPTAVQVSTSITSGIDGEGVGGLSSSTFTPSAHRSRSLGAFQGSDALLSVSRMNARGSSSSTFNSLPLVSAPL